MIVGTAIGVGIGRRPRWYIFMATRSRDDDGRVVYKIVAHRDDGYKYYRFIFKDRLDVEDVSEAVDELIKNIKRSEGFTFFEILGGSGVLNIAYMRRSEKGVWV